MKKHLAAIVICASTLALVAQQPKVSNANFTVEPIGGTLTATVDRFRHSGEQRWLGYEVPALPHSHFSMCSNWSDASSMDNECCGEYRLEDNSNYGVNRGNHPASEYNFYALL